MKHVKVLEKEASREERQENINVPLHQNKKGAKGVFQKIGLEIKPLLYLAPCLFFVILFSYYPFVRTFILSFSITNISGEISAFIGLEHFQNLINDPNLYNALGNSLKYALITAPVSVVTSLILALLAEESRPGSKFYQVMFGIPMAVSMSAAAMIFQLLLNPSIGMFNYLIQSDIRWFSDPDYALFGIILLSVWLALGFDYLFLLGALRNVPNELLEAADVEGAGYFQKLLKIKIPLISPTFFFVVITDVIGGLLVFAQVEIITGGGPRGSTETLMFWMYREGFQRGNYGYGSAIAIAIFVIVMFFTVLMFIYERKGVHYS